VAAGTFKRNRFTVKTEKPDEIERHGKIRVTHISREVLLG